MAKRRTPAEKALADAGKLTDRIASVNETFQERITKLGRERDKLLLFAYEEGNGEFTYKDIADLARIDRSRVNALLARAREEREA